MRPLARHSESNPTAAAVEAEAVSFNLDRVDFGEVTGQITRAVSGNRTCAET
jgi:hypothetical protein